MSYNPIPPRVWSRVQNPCTYTVPGSTYQNSFIPLTGQTVSQSQADYEAKLLYKGNILQHKGNSSRLTKQQKYTQLAKGFGPNRTKVFATQSQTYTNPNTTNLLRINYNTIPFPNQIVGSPNNISGPYQYDIPNPNGCTGTSIQDGGTLVCGTIANPCTGEIIKQGNTSSIICNPSSASDVPGSSILCWNNKVQTWFPKPRYTMNNSTSKWPEGYKGFVSAVTPSPPVLTLVSYTESQAIISWSYIISNCLPISKFNIYLNNVLIDSVPYTINTYTFNNLTCDNEIYITSVSDNIESFPSNIITINLLYQPFTYTGTPTIYYDSANKLWSILFTSTGTVNFIQNLSTNIFTLIVGGGGGGGKGSASTGGEGGYQAVNSFSSIVTGDTFTINSIGNGGPHGATGDATAGGDTSFTSPNLDTYTVTGGFPGLTSGGQVIGASYSGPPGSDIYTGGGGYGGGPWSNTCSNTNGSGGNSYLLNNNAGILTLTGINLLTYALSTYNISIGGGGGTGGTIGGEGGSHNGNGSGGASSCSPNLNTQDALGYGGGGGGYNSGSLTLNRSGDGRQGLFILFFNYPECI